MPTGWDRTEHQLVAGSGREIWRGPKNDRQRCVPPNERPWHNWHENVGGTRRSNGAGSEKRQIFMPRLKSQRKRHKNFDKHLSK